MPRCIFCRTDHGPFTTREHILPESLGGGDWAILTDGLFCDSCQNRFGSEIEQQALDDYPFSFFRVFLGVPTKKRKAPWMTSLEGTLRGSITPGTVGYDPAPVFERATIEGSKTVMRLLAHPIRPQMVCRTLLKMGIEVVGNDNAADVFDVRFDDARNYALTGKKDGEWWYLQKENMEAASHFITQGVSIDEWRQGIELTCFVVEDDAEMFHLRLLYLDMLVPLDSRIRPPDMSELHEPEYRLFVV